MHYPCGGLQLCRPCCPANFFLDMEDGVPKAPAAGAPPCVLCLSAHGLRCLQRFHAKHGQQAAMLFEEAGSRTPSSCECRLNDRAFWGRFVRQVREPVKRRAPVSTVPEELRGGERAAVNFSQTGLLLQQTCSAIVLDLGI